ncbi:hypothetical protein [Methylobacterium terrae]|uniref:hypothetical protein n=1 Tax=Methylobacterium terrae TaxID=2202827 RepID=UPI001ABF5248|nr:hypothetical protein [Methylobacterium terrae]
MTRSPRKIPQRRRIFLGCEGESERSYGVLLGRLVEARHRRVHIDAVILQPGGGDPLALVELAARQARRRADLGEDYAFKAVLLDGDTTGRNPDRDAKVAGTAERNGLMLIWQIPCHEALILRHLEGCAPCAQRTAPGRWKSFRSAGRNIERPFPPTGWPRGWTRPRCSGSPRPRRR